MIDWKPIAEIPEEIKDGRMLLFYSKRDDNIIYIELVSFGYWECLNGSFFIQHKHDIPITDGWLRAFTHYAEFNAPEELK